MKVSEVMTREVQTVRPDQPVQQAASFMLNADAGSIPVTDGDRLIGMITDRDIAIQGVAQGRGADAKVRDVMSEGIKYCYEDEDVQHVADNMARLGIRRLPVINRDKRLVGIVSLSNIVQCQDNARNVLLEGVAKPH